MCVYIYTYIYMYIYIYTHTHIHIWSFPGGTSGKESTSQCRLDIKNAGLIPGSGRSLGRRNGNPV